MKKILTIAGLLISYSTFAEIPHTFTSGTPAVASEVNQNFAAIDGNIISVLTKVENNAENIASITGQIGILENDVISNASDILSTSERITALEENIAVIPPDCNNYGEWSSIHHQQITYEPKSSVTGSVVVLSVRSYRTVEVPIVEFSTGDVYSIKFPVEESIFDEVSGTIYTEHVGTNVDCSQFTISGFPAYSRGILERRSISFVNNGFTNSSINLWLNYTLNIKIGETNLAIDFSYRKSEHSPIVTHSDYDFTDNLGAPIHRTEAISMVDDWIDYIQITKVQ